jgi:hypothetical protein
MPTDNHANSTLYLYWAEPRAPVYRTRLLRNGGPLSHTIQTKSHCRHNSRLHAPKPLHLLHTLAQADPPRLPSTCLSLLLSHVLVRANEPHPDENDVALLKHYALLLDTLVQIARCDRVVIVRDVGDAALLRVGVVVEEYPAPDYLALEY